MGLIILVLMLLVIFISNRMFNRLQKDFNDRLSIAIAATLSESISRVSFAGKFHTRMLVEDMQARVEELAYISVENKEFRILAHSDRQKNDKIITLAEQLEFQQCIQARSPVILEKIIQNKSMKEVLVPYSGGIDNELLGIVRLGIDLTAVKDSQGSIFVKLIALAAVLAMFFIIISYKLSRFFGKSVRKLANQLQGILDHAPIGIIISRQDGSIVLTGHDTADFFPTAEHCSDTASLYSSLNDPHTASRLLELDQMAFSGQKNMESEIDFASPTTGQVFWHVSHFPVERNESGETTLVCMMIRDLSAKVKAENQIRESEETFRRLFENSTDGINLLYDNRFIESNNATLKLLGGISRTDLTGKTILDFSPNQQLNGENSDLLWQKMLQDATTRGYNRCEWALSRSDGSMFIIDIAMTPITIRGASMLYMTWRDVTSHKLAEQEREKLQEQLLQSQKMDAIGQLAGGVAHDFNNMLSGIMGAAELLQGQNSNPEKAEKYIAMIISAGSRAAELTSKLMTFARKGKKVRRPMDIARCIADAIGILSRTLNKNISISFANNCESSLIIGDDTMLQNVFLNIGINAGHAMPEGGSVIFSLKNIILDEHYCRLSPYELAPGKYIEVEIRDSGCGMTPEIQKKIFEPFFTTKEPGKGTGLGLSVAYGIIKDHQGAINVYSEVGVGTVFHIYLPLATEGPIILKEEARLVFGSGRILLVDDEELIRNTSSSLLKSLGYEVVTAENGAEAVKIYSEKHAGIDLVILDMIMPVMGGKEALKKLREINPDCRVIISSGFSKEDEMSDISSGVSGFLPKPFRINELSETVARLTGKA
jgi:PAS domain S-box-containing protein